MKARGAEKSLRLLRHYVDTSVWNFLLEKDRPEHRKVTELFFDQMKKLGGSGISDVVLQEIQRAPHERQEAFRRVIEEVVSP